ncbi:MAG: flavoprotein [Candidatus Ratteibacteria bacterium]|jgi:phosphopantothenoylcysteine decarboxylase/phosphopantothenate--cysteine ligase
MFKGKKILLGVTGSIAAFKAATLTSALVKKGGRVKVVMTKEAACFVTPLTFRTLSGNPVYQEMFDSPEKPDIEHVSLAEWPDIILICPATANIISKVAAGLADDLLSAIILTTRKSVVFVPAMNSGMWQNKILQKKVTELKTAGYRFIGPAKGRLACGEEGEGRMVEVEKVIAEIA